MCYKNGEPNNYNCEIYQLVSLVNNTRPISLTAEVAKMFESIVKKWVDNKLKENNDFFMISKGRIAIFVSPRDVIL